VRSYSVFSGDGDPGLAIWLGLFSLLGGARQTFECPGCFVAVLMTGGIPSAVTTPDGHTEVGRAAVYRLRALRTARSCRRLRARGDGSLIAFVLVYLGIHLGCIYILKLLG